ncbi:MAG: rhomboid family intramembrane serine protease [Gemmatimonadetes bacterium]|nr:rhomboid family intramembrane serine protease [Gemmatimonadota bacterium]
MPAILCPSCHKLISDDVPRCHHCGQIRPGMFGLASRFRQLGVRLDFPHVVTVFCGALYALCLALDPGAILQPRGMMDILAPSGEASFHAGATGSYPVFQYGRWWTVITAIYLHGNLLHIIFNMMWVRQLGPVVEELFGPFRLFVIFTVAGAVGFVASTIMGSGLTLGASGSIFGLLAAAIVYGRRVGSDMFTRQFLQWALIMFVFGIIVPGIDNWAHGGGFVGGYVTAWVFSRSPSDREGLGAYVLAGVCALVTVLAFLLQFLAAFA